jgi:hypothetical protein
LIVRLLGIFVTLCGSLALLTRFLTATLLLTGRLVLLAGLALVCHVVPFIGTSQQRISVRVVPTNEKWQFALPTGSPTHSGLHFLIHCSLCFLSLAIAPS